MEEKLKKYLQSMVDNEGSDLHLQAGSIPRVRIHGELRVLGKTVLSNSDLKKLVREISTDEQWQTLLEEKNLDFTYVMGDYRFRINYFHQMNGYSAVFRVIPVKIATIHELNLPNVINDFVDMHRGLVLVTGVTGSGKSTTLAAIINAINEKYKKHIITVEDPVEFIHKNKNSLINQRGIGPDANSFSDALRGALREDPDIILVGEMRDLETIDIALHAANTGHLVFSTLHTLDAKETIDRVIGMFPTNEQNRIRKSLASVLEGVISQRLVPTIEGGRAAGIEVLKRTSRIEQLISEGRDFEIPDTIADGKEIYGTQTFDQALLDLYHLGRISEETTLNYATNQSDMKLRIQGIGGGTVKNNNSTNNDLEFFDLKEHD